MGIVFVRPKEVLQQWRRDEFLPVGHHFL